MGDGTIFRKTENHNPNLRISVIQRDYLEYLDGVFGQLSTGVMLSRTAEEGAEKNRKSGFSPNAVEENYSDVYRLITRNHPELSEYHNWYSGGKKTFPDDINLTPTTLKHWFVCDGNMSDTRIRIGLSNERNNKEKIESYFPVPVQRWDETSRSDGSIRCAAVFSTENSKKLFSYMGEPLPGFGYKWP